MTIFDDQLTFMRACGQVTAEGLNVETGMWKSLIEEEYSELITALRQFQQQPVLNLKANVVKESIDLIYVIAGLLNNLKVPAETVWNAVHLSNMAKVDPTTGQIIKRSDGKVLKPSGWKAPDILAILMEYHNANNLPR